MLSGPFKDSHFAGSSARSSMMEGSAMDRVAVMQRRRRRRKQTAGGGKRATENGIFYAFYLPQTWARIYTPHRNTLMQSHSPSAF